MLLRRTSAWTLLPQRLNFIIFPIFSGIFASGQSVCIPMLNDGLVVFLQFLNHPEGHPVRVLSKHPTQAGLVSPDDNFQPQDVGSEPTQRLHLG